MTFGFLAINKEPDGENKILMERAIIREAICLGREEKRFKEEDILFGNSKSYLRLIGKRKEV